MSTKQLAKHFKDVHFGGNWTCVNLKDTLKDITWQEANTNIQNLNTIGVLVFHINYYISAVLKVLDGQPLEAHDKFSFDAPEIQSEEDWQQLLAKVFSEAERFAEKLEQLDEPKLYEDFSDVKYGTYFRNMLGIIEHTHYHLGQISLIRKIIRQDGSGL